MAAYLIPPIETVVIKPWLEAKLKALGITAHKFASEMRVTSATIYRWYSDQYRPDSCDCWRIPNESPQVTANPVFAELGAGMDDAKRVCRY